MRKYIYKVNNKGVWEDYSGYFTEKEKALLWYKKEGSRLEKLFKRKLYLFPRAISDFPVDL